MVGVGVRVFPLGDGCLGLRFLAEVGWGKVRYHHHWFGWG